MRRSNRYGSVVDLELANAWGNRVILGVLLLELGGRREEKRMLLWWTQNFGHKNG
jgi:hypothetical protein